MRNLHHICVASHSEVLFRSPEDINMAINYLALTALNTNSHILADALMSNHIHLIVMTENPEEFSRRFRIHYVKYFNHKYSRHGSLGEQGAFSLKIEGDRHAVAAISYVLRNGLHHGQAATAFAYKYTSIKEYFTEQMGFERYHGSILNSSEMRKALKKWHNVPDHYVMSSEGVFLRHSFEEITLVEMLYVSAKSFQFYTRGNTENMWAKDQENDNTGKPIELSSIEDPRVYKSEDLFINECRRFDQKKMDDFQVCHLIDSILLKKFKVSSIYVLWESAKEDIFKDLIYNYCISGKRAQRCLGGWLPSWYVPQDTNKRIKERSE